MPNEEEEAILDESSLGSDAARHGTGSAPSVESDSRKLSRNEDSDTGHGGNLVERGREDVAGINQSSVAGDWTPANSEQIAHLEEYHLRIAPLPTPQEFDAYEKILPGAADRIVAMAEKSQDAQIEDNHRAAKAEEYSFIFASFGVAYFPWVLAAATVALVIGGQPAAAVLTGIATAGFAGPQIIAAARPAKKDEKSKK